MEKTLLRSNGTFRHDLPPKEAISVLTPRGSFALVSAHTYVLTLPHLQLPKRLEGENLDRPWEANTRDVNQLKKEYSGY